jgi:hypothetical protein
VNAQDGILPGKVFLGARKECRISFQKSFNVVVGNEHENGTKFIIKKLVCEVGALFYKNDIAFSYLVGMINGPPYFSAGGYECKIVVVRPQSELRFFTHAGIFHKQKFVHLHLSEPVTVFYSGVKI